MTHDHAFGSVHASDGFDYRQGVDLHRNLTHGTDIQDRIDGLSNTGRADHEFNKLRLTLRELTVKWMQTLETQNVSTNVDIDLNLRFTFGGETLDVIGSGSSTTIRLVLAIHAALLEACLSDKSRPFRFLILDTPKQEELHTADLAAIPRGAREDVRGERCPASLFVHRV
ncbi:hypothetical protein [Paraburkholderia kururiensis]|uniref:hypothetical protein n=1 Tax=Paraburkholderia kururiensis TaxID=984307 RepID=UPI0039A4C398